MFKKHPDAVFTPGAAKQMYQPGSGCTAVMMFTFYGTVILIAIVFNVLMNQGRPVEAEPFEYLPALAAGFVIPAAMTAFILIPNQIRAWREGRAIRQLTEGEAWVVWQYAPDEWRWLAEKQAAYETTLLRPFSVRNQLILFTVIVLGGGALAYMLREELPPLVQSLYIVLGFFIAFFVLGSSLVGGMRQRKQMQDLHARRSSLTAPRVYINQAGFFHESEGYYSLKRLVEVRIDSGAPNLLTFMVKQSMGRYGSIRVPISFPIPAAALSDAQRLLQRFRH